MNIKRDFQDKYFELIDKNVISVLLGPRRAGKTTFVEQYLETKVGLVKVSFNFDQLSTREEIVKHGIERLILAKLAPEKKQDVIVFVDEVQKEPKVFDQIKIIYDKQKKELKRKNQIYKFILTGSASLNIQSRLSESLAGRVELLNVSPFSFSEAAKIKRAGDLAKDASIILGGAGGGNDSFGQGGGRDISRIKDALLIVEQSILEK